jgi:protein Hikeshi
MEVIETMMIFGESAISHIAQIGISLEPEPNVLNQTSQTQTNEAETSYVFGKKMLESFMNFASSFTIRQSEMQPNPSETYVPVSTLNNWFTNFERRLQQNPNFWK